MSGARRALARLRPGVVFAMLLFPLLAVGLAEWMIERQHRNDLDAAFRQQALLAQGGARTAAEIIERTLDLARTVHSVASLARNQHLRGSPQDAQPLEAILTELAREERSSILQIAIINDVGRLVFSTVPGWQSMDLSDREHFRVHEAGLRDPFVSAPLVGRASGRWSLQLTQSILSEHDGAFAGVVVVSVDPMLISEALRQRQFDTDTVTALIRRDGTILARSHAAETAMGQRLPEQLLRDLLAVPQGLDALTSSVTGEPLTVAWRQIDHWPLVVAHGLRRPPVLAAAAAQKAEWRLRAALMLGVLAALGAAILMWRARRRAAHEAARADASRREMAELVAALPGAAYRGLANADGSITLLQVTAALSRLTGREPRGTSPALDWDDLLDDEARKGRSVHLSTVSTQGESVTEYRLQRADGRWIWVRDHARARRAGSGRGHEVVGVLSDITQEREMAAQAVGNAKLVTLGEMATGLAHELNQPAAAIALAADLASVELASGQPTAQARARDRLELIVRQIMRMREIVQHLQMFGRADPQARPLEAIRLDEALAGAMSLVRGTLNASEISVETDLPADLPPVLGHLVPLEQVLVNILLNARDAMEATPAAARRVCITAGTEAGEAWLSIRDTGPGFTPEQRARVFEPFFTTKPLGKGTGLGLAIAYGTMRSFGGRITLGRAPTAGAELVLHLRTAVAEEAGASRTELPAKEKVPG